MSWRHLVVPGERWSDACDWVRAHDEPVAVTFSGASTPMLAAAVREWPRGIYVWLRLDATYSSPVAARDVATLSWVIDLRGVVIDSGDGLEVDHAEIMIALVSRDDVSLSNRAATLRHAYNRPLPPHELEIWTANGAPDDTLVEFTRRSPGAAPDVVRSRRATLDD